MAAILHFAVLSGLAVLAVAVVARFYEKPTALRVAVAVVVSLGLGLGTAALGVHACDRGLPLSQWIAPALLLGIVLLLVGNKLVRFGVASVIGVAMVALTLHYNVAVHGDEWLGHAGPVMAGERASFEWHTAVTGLYRIER
jgi:hypothetical protein